MSLLSQRVHRTVRFLLLAACGGAALAASPAATTVVQELPHSRAVTYLNGQSSWFVCDGLNSPTVSVLGWPAASGRSRLTTYRKDGSGNFVYHNYSVGAGDAGAGQIHYPLRLSAGASTSYSVGSFNTGGLDHPEHALTPPILNLTSAETSTDCRWVVNTRVLGFSNRRSVMITQAPGGPLTYQTWNFGSGLSAPSMPDGVQRTSAPSLSIAGGSRLISSTQESFVFQNAGYTYTVRVARIGQPGAASVTVSRGGKVLQVEPLVGYTYAVVK